MAPKLRAARATDNRAALLRRYPEVRMRQHGYVPVPAYNPYWDRHGLTFEDPDGYRVMLQHAD